MNIVIWSLRDIQQGWYPDHVTLCHFHNNSPLNLLISKCRQWDDVIQKSLFYILNNSTKSECICKTVSPTKRRNKKVPHNYKSKLSPPCRLYLVKIKDIKKSGATLENQMVLRFYCGCCWCCCCFTFGHLTKKKNIWLVLRIQAPEKMRLTVRFVNLCLSCLSEWTMRKRCRQK